MGWVRNWLLNKWNFFSNNSSLLSPFQDPSSLDIYSIGQDHYPPSYESVIEYDDLSSPPPPYDHVVHECIVVLDKTTTASSSSSPGTETKKYPVTVQLIDERQIANYI